MKNLSECTILLVDDAEANIEILVDVLGEQYEVLVAMDGESALELIDQEPPDLILLDIMMPGMDGYEVCRRLKQHPDHCRIPVIFLSALAETDNKTRGFQVGGIDYITKPFEVAEVNARVRTHLLLVMASRELEQQNEILEAKVRRRTNELMVTQDVTIHSLATLAEARDNETGGHILRTRGYVRLLAETLAAGAPSRASLDKPTIELLYKSAPLHDIGKVGVPDSILLKPGRLTEAEFAIMKTHAEIGYQALLKAECILDVENAPSFLSHARDIAYTHHEKWDGSGYPRGLKGDMIPLSGRIMALSDVYDALISRRVYKPPFSHQRAREIVVEGKGRHFDPQLVDVFLAVETGFIEIAARYADQD